MADFTITMKFDTDYLLNNSNYLHNGTISDTVGDNWAFISQDGDVGISHHDNPSLFTSTAHVDDIITFVAKAHNPPADSNPVIMITGIDFDLDYLGDQNPHNIPAGGVSQISFTAKHSMPTDPNSNHITPMGYTVSFNINGIGFQFDPKIRVQPKVS